MTYTAVMAFVAQAKQYDAYLAELRERAWLRRIMPKWRASTPTTRCWLVMKRISRERFFSTEEMDQLIHRLASKFSGNPASVSKALRANSLARRVGFYRGKWIKTPWPAEIDEAMRDARSSGALFTDIETHNKHRERGRHIRTERDIRIVRTNRRLINEIKQEIRNGKEHSDRRAAA